MGTSWETIVVALVVGAVSGLFGSIAGPFLAHQLDRRRRQELRKEERQRNLRQMLDTMMRVARTQAYGLGEIKLVRLLNRDEQEARLRQRRYILDLEARYPEFFWRPKRILDPQLRDLALELEQATAYASILYDSDLAPSSREEWDEQAEAAAKRVYKALDDVERQIDELDW